MSNPKCYIAGKIGNLQPHVYTTHFECGKRLAALHGYDPVSPLDLPHNHGRSWGEYMIEDLEALRKCQAIILLPTWTESPGARIEAAFAEKMDSHTDDESTEPRTAVSR
jgi:hypothetical protein